MLICLYDLKMPKIPLNKSVFKMRKISFSQNFQKVEKVVDIKFLMMINFV